MEDIASLGFCSPNYFPFSNVKNEEYANIENLLSSDTEENTINYGQESDKKSSKKHSFCSELPNVNSEDSEPEKNIPQLHSRKKKKKKHSSHSAVSNPFMSARQVSLQPSASDLSEKTDMDNMSSDSEDKYKNRYLRQDEDVTCEPNSELSDYNADDQKAFDKDLRFKDNETKKEKIKPVFGRSAKKTDHISKKSKKSQGNLLDVKSDMKNKKKDSLSTEIHLDDPKSLSDHSHCIITEEDEDSFCLSAKICSQNSSKKNKEEEQIVPNFSWKKSKSKSKHVEKSPLKEMNMSVNLKDNKNSETLKHKKRSLIEISSSILNSDHHHKKESSNNAHSEKRSKEKKKKSKNSAEKSDTCSMIKEENLSSPEATEEICNIPKKKRKKSIDTSSLTDLHEDENNGPVITNIQPLVDNFDQDLKNVESLCPSQNDIQSATESPMSTDKFVDQQEHKKKKKKKKSKDESPKEESKLCEKLVKKHKKKKKKEKPDRNENVKVEMMPAEMVPAIDEHEAEEEIDSPKDIDSGSDKEEPQAVSPGERVKCKSSEKPVKQFSVKKKDEKSKKKELKKLEQKHSKDKNKKKCSATNKKKVRCKRFCMQEREIFDTGTWVQCTNSECLKWRFLHDVQDPITVPMLWTCDMNTDTKQNDCSYPEIVFPNKDNEEFIYTKYTEGTVVWARVDGYPWWPAMVEMDPDSMSYFDIETEDSMYPKFYHVVFFGKKVSRAWVTLSNIAPFSESKPPPTSKGMPRVKTQEVNVAEKLAIKALELPIKTRLKMFSFSSRYKGTWGDCNCHGCMQAMSTADQDSEDSL